MMRPRGFKHLLECQRCDSKKAPDAGVGICDDRAAIAPLLFALHHDVAVGYRFVVVEELLVVPPNAGWCLFFHVFFYVLGGLVQEEERLLVHPRVDRRLVVDVGAIYHEVGVGVVLVVNDVIVGKGGEEVLDESMCKSRLVSLLFLMLLPLFLKEHLEAFQDAIVAGK